ncbi:cybS, succinate dehydrogenase cytochrome B small subunit domain-containing protein [Phthorimaea operculella]|nr:cybS, succinate dehydrogenase cytochrome B small subunit domain-containing protein [Phthorimaea operculella]
MALSMFLRTPACLNPLLRQSVARFTTKSSAVQSNLPVSTMLLNNTTPLSKAVKSSPILDSVRSLRTSSVRQTFAKDEHAHDHAKLWVIEKSVTALMVPLIPAALMFPNKGLDVAVAILITAHSHWGLEACVVEYCRTIIFGHLLPKLAMLVVYAWSILQLAGLLYLSLNCGGMANAFWRFWLDMGKPCGGEKEAAAAAASSPPKCPPKEPHLNKEKRRETGLEAIAVDYVRAAIFGPVIPKIAIALVYLISVATLGGLFYLISHDVGFGQAVRDIWAVKADKKA